TQQAGVEAAAAQMLCQRTEVFIPGFVEDRPANLSGRRAPPRRFARQFESFDHSRPAVQGHLAQGRGIGEYPALRTHFPDAVIRIAPLAGGGFDQSAEPLPQLFINLAAMRRPFVSAIENLAVDVVLNLFGRRVAPSHRTRVTIAFKPLVCALRRRVAAVQVIERSWTTASLDRVQRPTEKPQRLLRAADAIKRVYRERRVAQPRIAIIPVAFAADYLR